MGVGRVWRTGRSVSAAVGTVSAGGGEWGTRSVWGAAVGVAADVDGRTQDEEEEIEERVGFAVVHTYLFDACR